MKVAVVGAGVSGLVAARALSRHHEVSVFEAADYAGGHTHTVDVQCGDRSWPVDTGFIVCNDRTYPRFHALLQELGVRTRPTHMTLSVGVDYTGVEYSGDGFGGVFAQSGNLLRPAFWRLLADIRRFGNELREALPQLDPAVTIGEFVGPRRYGSLFYDHYLVPMISAVWSAPAGQVAQFPARFFGDFFDHHGLLTFRDRPCWQVVEGGSRSYVAPLTASFRERLYLRTPVVRVLRDPQGVRLRTGTGDEAHFDRVVLACHSDQALRMLGDASAQEQALLSALPYERNEVVLHTDTRALPRAQRAWACWNYRVRGSDQPAVVTYNMNRLQGFDAPETFCVTLNDSAQLAPERILNRFVYHHPVYTPQGVHARARLQDISGAGHIFYAGAYWGDGFHEAGVVSGERAAAAVEASAP